jgi:hypothetical protein
MRILAAGLWLLCLASGAGRAFAADAPLPAAVQPYDAPPPSAPGVPALRPQATDGEVPRRVVTPLVSPTVAREPRPEHPREPGRIVAESLVAFLVADVSLVVGLFGGVWPLFLGPFATGGVVCAIGHGSDSFDGSCLAAIGGSYVGSLISFPLAFAFYLALKHGSEDSAGSILGGFIIGYVVGSAAGAIIGWNASRRPKAQVRADDSRLDALAAARAAPWTEPLRPRGSLAAVAEPRLSAPLLSFRF